jgi:hypothetical protein
LAGENWRVRTGRQELAGKKNSLQKKKKKNVSISEVGTPQSARDKLTAWTSGQELAGENWRARTGGGELAGENCRARIGGRELAGENWCVRTGRRELMGENWRARTGRHELAGENYGENWQASKFLQKDFFQHNSSMNSLK